VVTNYTKAGLPLEALWVDIEAMNNRFQVFTFDKDRYPAAKMRAFASKLAAAGQHWAPIFNPGISVQQGYRAYEEGSAQGVWIKDVNGNPYKGQVRACCVCFVGLRCCACKHLHAVHRCSFVLWCVQW
jgi:alpha-glucosidase (family GH31 glycosyl hydrolase)